MLLETVDRVLTAVTLKADFIASRYSYRVGRCIEAVSTGAHQTMRFISHRFGWASVSRELVGACQRERPKAIPRYLSHREDATEQRRADELLRGIYPVGENSSVPVGELSWLRDPFENYPSVSRFLFHVLYDVKSLVERYHASGNTRFLSVAKDLTTRWISECLHTERWGQVWDDHCTAIRAIMLCQLWGAARPSEPFGSVFMKELFSAIVRHAEKLAHRSFYRPNHNHGVTQAYALLAIGLLFRLHPRAQGWVHLALLRLEKQMQENVSPEGFHREHSPSYHFFVFQQMLEAHRLASSYGITFSMEFRAGLGSMLKAGAQLLKPDGMLPALGDSFRTAATRMREFDLDGLLPEALDAYLYSSSQGEEGTPPSDASILSPGAGYAIFRSGWGTSEPFKNERFLLFRLSTFQTSHIHRDAFSFELSAYGSDLIVDSGGPFVYGHRLREGYFTATKAHNTVVVDHKDQNIGEARVLQWRISPGASVLDVEHHNYPAVRHRRVVAFVRKTYFLILDRLESACPHHYSQIFHLEPNLEARIVDLGIVTNNPLLGATVQIIPLLREGLGISLYRGILNPAQGWVCGAGEFMIPNTAVEYQRSGPIASFAVLVVPEPPLSFVHANWKIEGVPFQEDTRIHVVLNGHQDELILSANGQVVVNGT